ncbi:helix-turn-helix transcriptional regulator [Kribbella endophytica]
MANTSSRTLRLLSLLQARRYWPGPLLAERLEVSPRTLRRDVERLRELGYPVDANPGVDGGYALAPGASLPPLVVDDDEAMALAIAVQSHLDDQAALRALTKIVQVMPRRLRARLNAVRAATPTTNPNPNPNLTATANPKPNATATPALTTTTNPALNPTTAPWGTPPLDHEILTTLALACRDSERIRLRYRAIDAKRTQREVEPYHLVPLGRRWYLVAYDLERHDWRTFRIDRITAAEGAGTSYGPRPLPYDDVTEFVRANVRGGTQQGRYAVEVVAEAPAEAVAAHFGRWAEVQVVTPTSSRVLMETDSLDGPLFSLGALGTEFRVVGPPELAVAAKDWATRFARAVNAAD